MLKQIFALVIALFMYHGLFACDGCSGTSLNSLNGQLLPSNKTFVGLSSSYVHQLDDSKQRINNSSYGLFAAFSFAKKWQILAGIPVQYRVIDAKTQAKSSQFGLGDASLLLSYNAFSTSTQKEAKSKSILIIRGGVKFPTGYHEDDNTLNSNFGTKSWDILMGAQYIFERNKQGLNIALDARMNTLNPNNYKYGNTFRFSSFYFVKREKAKQSYMPFVGVSGDWMDLDQSNGFLRELSGGKGLYGMGGFMWNWNDRMAIFAKGELPIIQDYLVQEGSIYTNIRAQIQLTYYLKNNTKPSKTVKL